LSAEIGIDLGTATTIVYVKGKGIVALEPSIVAINKHDENYLKIGTEAYKMLGRTPSHIELIRPLEEGVISNFKIALKLLRHYIKKYSTSFSQPKIMICVPSQVNDIEKRAVIDAAMQAGAGKVYLIEEPVAAALGSGIDITKPSGNLIVDIGGGTTDIAVIANKGSVLSSTINIASSKFDETIITSNLVTGNFIDYESIIPKNEKSTVTVRVSDLKSAIDRVSLLSNNKLIKFESKDFMMNITSRNDQVGNANEIVDITLDGENFEIAFNCEFLLDILRNVEDEYITMKISNSLSPCKITSQSDENYIHVILPVRIKK